MDRLNNQAKGESAAQGIAPGLSNDAEATLSAIRAGAVDALVIDGARGKQIFTLHGADEPYRIMVEQMDEGAVTVSAEGVILYANRRFARMVQRPLTKVLGSSVREYISSQSADAALAALRASAAERPAREVEMRATLDLIGAEGATCPVQVSASGVELEGQRCYCLIVTDLTAQREHEKARRNEAHLREVAEVLEMRIAERTAEVQHRVAQLQSLALELSRAEHRERKRLAKVLHDGLQQLLVAAKMRAGLLESALSGDSGRSDLDDLRETLAESLELSRSLTAELSPPVLHDSGLPAALDWLARWMSEKHRLKVDVRADPDANPADDDLRVFLFEAAREALLNVAKHAGVDRARVSLAPDGNGRLCLRIEDDGKGIDPVAEGQAGRVTGGFGLLSIRERLSMLGGELELLSGEASAQFPGKRGTRVSLYVPMQRFATAPARVEMPVIRAPAQCRLPRSNRIRVLLADDHRLVRQGLVGILSRKPDIEVVGEALDGRAALELARELRPDVILMDINMPHLDGFEATRQITAELPEVRVIALSMNTDAGARKQMRLAGAADYRTKDGPVEALVAAIRRCCSRTRTAK